MTINHFDASAQNWDTEETILRNDHFVQNIKEYLPGDLSGKSALDFGCGTGLMSSYFAANMKALVGIDTSTGMLDKFNQRFKNSPSVTSLCLDLEKEDLPQGFIPFDVIMTGMAFHHLKEPLKILEKLKRYLSKSGKIFIIDLDAEDGSFHPDNSSMGVQHFGFSKQELESWGQELKFKSFHHKIIYQIDKNNRHYPIAMAVYENA